MFLCTLFSFFEKVIFGDLSFFFPPYFLDALSLDALNL